MNSEKLVTKSTKRRDAVVHLSYRQQYKYAKEQVRQLQRENAQLNKDYAKAKVELMHLQRELAKLQVEHSYTIKLVH